MNSLLSNALASFVNMHDGCRCINVTPHGLVVRSYYTQAGQLCRELQLIPFRWSAVREWLGY